MFYNQNLKFFKVGPGQNPTSIQNYMFLYLIVQIRILRLILSIKNIKKKFMIVFFHYLTQN